MNKRAPLEVETTLKALIIELDLAERADIETNDFCG